LQTGDGGLPRRVVVMSWHRMSQHMQGAVDL
jgi:hypothetical protein